MKKRNKKIKKIRNILIISVAVLVLIFLIYNGVSSTGKSISSQEITIVPLSSEEIEKVSTTILSNNLIKEIPERYPIALRFFDFQNGQRRWRDSFLIGRNQLLTEGEPAISLTLHTKYIPEFNNENFCEVIKQANENRDLGFYSRYNKASLFVKYAGMLKYKDCFGF